MKTTRVIAGSALGLLILTGCGAAAGDESENQSSENQSSLPQEILSKGVLVASDSGSVMPLKYTEEGNDEIIGLIPDLTAEYTDRLGIDLEIERTSGDGVVPGVLSGKHDVALALGDFAERRETMDFVDLVQGGVAILVESGNPASVEDRDSLCGLSVSVVKGSLVQTFVEEEDAECTANGDEPIDIQGFGDGPAATLALESSRVDAHWTDLAVANQLIADNPDTFEMAGEPEWLAPYGVGVPKDQPELRDAIFEAVAEMHEDGTYHEILEEWNQESLALDEIEINGSEF